MRQPLLALVSACLAVALPACGGATADDVSRAAPSCTTTRLVASSPTKVGMGSGAAQVTMAATPSGDRFLVVWSPTGDASRQAVVVRAGQGAPSVSSPVTVPVGGVAAFDGTAFDVVGLGLAFQRVDLEGRLLGAEVSPSPQLSVTRVGWPAATTSPGVAVVAYRENPGPGLPPTLEADVLSTDGRVLQTQPLVAGAGGYDPYYGHGPTAAIAAHDGDAFALSTNTLVAHDAVTLSVLGGSGEPSVSNVVGQATSTTILQLLPVGNRLAFPLNGELWEGPVAGPFSRVGEVGGFDVAADGCGRLVTLSTPGVQASATTLSAAAWGSDTKVQVATDFVAPGPPLYWDALVPTSYGFGVAWTGTDGVEFATLGWQ